MGGSVGWRRRLPRLCRMLTERVTSLAWTPVANGNSAAAFAGRMTEPGKAQRLGDSLSMG